MISIQVATAAWIFSTSISLDDNSLYLGRVYRRKALPLFLLWFFGVITYLRRNQKTLGVFYPHCYIKKSHRFLSGIICSNTPEAMQGYLDY